MNTIFISIVSGKGGTGKSLMSAVLGTMLSKMGKKVLLVDLDIHVRGLSVLLANYLIDVQDGKLTVSDLMDEKRNDSDPPEYAICRFERCDFIPSVRNCEERLNYNDIQNSKEFNKKFADELCEYSKNANYDIVIFDCRAGIDNNVLSICEHSKLVLSVSEDDDVCLKTNLNLIGHLKHKEEINNIYTIINKGKRIKSVEELETRISNEKIYALGVIPFDMDTMEDYGKERFWSNLTNTFYYYSLCVCWNSIAEKIKAEKIDLEKIEYKKPNFLKISKNSRLNYMQRVLSIYGIISALLAVGLSVYALVGTDNKIIPENPFIIISGVLFLVSIASFLLSTFSMKKYIHGEFDKPSLSENSTNHPHPK